MILRGITKQIAEEIDIYFCNQAFGFYRDYDYMREDHRLEVMRYITTYLRNFCFAGIIRTQPQQKRIRDQLWEYYRLGIQYQNMLDMEIQKRLKEKNWPKIGEILL